MKDLTGVSSDRPGVETMKPDSGEHGSASGEPLFPLLGWERYEVIRFLGKGGMGQVFLVHDQRLNKKVALKFALGHDAKLFRDLQAEARKQASVEHEHVCQVYDVSEFKGQPFIAMQYVHDGPLDKLVGGLTVEQKALVIQGAAEGIHAAHSVALIHRDIKPSNILVERTEDGRLKPYVMDFGVAREWKEQGATTTGAPVGTPQYMAPEQARGSRLDRRADVYGLGATLYFFLTGQPPIPGDNVLEVLNNIPTVEPRHPRSLDRDIPEDLEAIVLKCLEKDRSDRYDSARALAEDLGRFLVGEPVIARRGGLRYWWYWLRKKARKHRLVVGLSTAALLAVTLALGWGGWSYRQASLREQLARRVAEQVERIEALARYSGLSRLHDTREDRKALRAHLARLEEQLIDAGALTAGSVNYTLGRGYLVLGDEAQARKYLEAAWQGGFREPRAAYALALVMGHLYQEQLQEAERLRDPTQREDRKRLLQARFRDPALDYLRQTTDAEVPSIEYVKALIDFYEERFDEALLRLETVEDTLPWFYEARQLRGDILRARATQHWNRGDPEGARKDFAAGRAAYTAAAEIGASVLDIALAQAGLEYDELEMELYSSGNAQPAFERGREVVARALRIAPDRPEARLMEARLHRRFAEYSLNKGTSAEQSLEGALKAAEDAVRLDPSSARARLELGQCLWLWGRALKEKGQDPRSPLRQATEQLELIGPEHRDSDFYFRRGLIFEIQFSYEQGIGVDPLPSLDKALEDYIAATRLDERLLSAWLNLSRMYFERASHPLAKDPEGDLSKAHTALDKARALNPQHTGVFNLGGRLCELEAHRRRVQASDARPAWLCALESYRQGLAINEKLPDFHYSVGYVLLELAREDWNRGEAPFPRIDLAIKAFEQARDVAPDQGDAQHNLSEAFLQRVSYERARGDSPSESLSSAIRASLQAVALRDEGFTWTNLGTGYALLARFELEQRRDPSEALEKGEKALSMALQKNPNEAQALLYRGEIRGVRARWRADRGQGQSEDFDDAAKDFKRAIELDPKSPDYRLAFGSFCHEWASSQKKLGQDSQSALKAGLEQAERLIDIRPGWPDALVLHARLLLLQVKMNSCAEDCLSLRRQAQRELQTALQINPQLKRRWGDELSRLEQVLGPVP